MNVENPKKQDNERKKIQNQEENCDEDIIDNEIDLWEKKFQKLKTEKNLKKLKTQISSLHQKSQTYNFAGEKAIHVAKKLKLPALIQNEKLNFEKKYSTAISAVSV